MIPVVHRQAQQLAASFGPKGDLLINSQTRLDQFFLHSWFGGISFILIMFLLFQSIFTWAAPIMDAVEAVLQLAASVVVPLLPAGAVSDFVSDALFGGIGAFLVFVPQIFILTLVVGMLEDSGYLARAAVICHKPLRYLALPARALSRCSPVWPVLFREFMLPAPWTLRASAGSPIWPSL